MALEYPKINGERASWADVEFKLDGRYSYGVTDVDYSTALEPGGVRGSGARKIGRTTGLEENEASITMLKQEADAFIKRLSQLSGGRGFGRKSFDMIVQYSHDTAEVVTDELRGCRVKRVGNVHTQSNEPLKVKLDLDVMRIKLNGQEIVK